MRINLKGKKKCQFCDHWTKLVYVEKIDGELFRYCKDCALLTGHWVVDLRDWD